jgi:phage tail sheath protein FI
MPPAGGAPAGKGAGAAAAAAAAGAAPAAGATAPAAAPTSPPQQDFVANGSGYYLQQSAGRYLLYYCMKHFFQNGGSECYIVSVGDYNTPPGANDLMAGVDALVTEREPTLVLAPDVLLLDSGNCFTVQQHMLMHCGQIMQNRMAVLDVYNGDKGPLDPTGDPVKAFRDGVGMNFLNYGAAYYPWLNTTIVQTSDLNYQTFDTAALAKVLANDSGIAPDVRAAITASGAARDEIQKSLIVNSKLYATIVAAAARRLNLLPPSAAMAGLYAMVDDTRGVWKAPANVSVNAAISPAVGISDADQSRLNVDPYGKSINAIRSFIGEGVLVWGARTLDGNSDDWRYVNVRRTLLFLEESCRLAAKAMVFEPNVAGTWVLVRSMIENFLTTIWKQGGLAGATREDAFAVHVGLGDTMTAEDILQGIMRVTVFVAVSHPAEFIEITFQQQMQKS